MRIILPILCNDLFLLNISQNLSMLINTNDVITVVTAQCPAGQLFTIHQHNLWPMGIQVVYNLGLIGSHLLFKLQDVLRLETQRKDLSSSFLSSLR